MKNKNLIIIILTLLVLSLTGYIVYDKLIAQENNNIGINNETENINLENVQYDVKEDIVGKYVNKDDQNDYFILNSNGTANISFPTGDNGSVITKNVNFQIAYNNKIVVLTFSDTTYSPTRLGYLTEEGYVFATTTETPSAGTLQFVYTKVK